MKPVLRNSRYWLYFCPTLTLFLKTVQVTCAALRTIEEIQATTPQLHLSRDLPQLTGEHVRYVMVFYFDEEGEKSFVRVRSLLLGQGPLNTVPLEGHPTGWGTVSMVIGQIFGSPGDLVAVSETPASQ